MKIIMAENDKILSKYCCQSSLMFRSDAIISEITQSRLSTNIIHQRQNELGHRLPLGSYLVLPVQRILRYHLLLKVGVMLKLIYKWNK